ncbi:hypothetical protein CPAR01_03300 [Colletotrichum paranaense]|uniref:Uncharacterized protein n=1 Tax=Colletotrichum paranaense TaxID=1914294 RepID=A0ABQ9T219_9PEZI|nr:uncharacterized protein CPAR01_03300 [Colletotrichum paranaense]KAK1545798.1 hypothetical protein CPAR01_03300 [Colletotrichum paranaense]
MAGLGRLWSAQLLPCRCPASPLGAAVPRRAEARQGVDDCAKSTPVFWVPNNSQLSSNLLREAHRRWKSRVGKYLSEVERARPATVLGLAPTTGKRVFLSADGMKLGNPNARSSFHGDGSLTWSILVDPEHRPSLATVWFGSTISVARVTFFGPDAVYHQAYVGARPRFNVASRQDEDGQFQSTPPGCDRGRYITLG